VYGVVLQLGGFTKIESVAGVGTIVQIFLPVAERETESAPSDAAVVDVLGRGETILVVDDDDDTRNATARILTEAGYVVIAESRAAGALKTLESRAPDISVILTDVVMPDISGRVLAQRAGERWPQIPVLLMSGYEPDAERAADATTQTLLLKPLLRPALLAAVAAALEGNHGHGSNQ
jgi:CheY-like chemotaxis protein